MRFTDKAVKALRPKVARYEVWEGGGFGLRVTPRGVKTWVWVYRFKGRTRRMTFDTYPAIGLADARIALTAAQKLLEGGVDPGEHGVAHKRAERLAETVTELADEYIDKWAKPRKRSAAEDKRVLYKDVLPKWGTRKAKEITRKDVIALLDKIVSRGAPIQANRTLAVIRKMYAWAISRDLVSINPCMAVAPPAGENRRDRVLTAEEIHALWSGLESPDLSMTPAIRLALKFQLVTAQRRGEVIEAEWCEFDTEGEKVWTIPGGRAKNGMAHRVPLSPLAISLLAEIKKATAKKPKDGEDPIQSRFLFPSPRGDKAITGRAVDHAMRLGRTASEEGVAPILTIIDASPHDLRRTAASYMTSAGTSRLVVSKILNHAEVGVTAVYDRHSYDKEKRGALEAWGRQLTDIVSGNWRTRNVVAFARA